MERDRSRTSSESVRRAEERGRWREAASREQDNVEQRAGEAAEQDRVGRERLERERLERERMGREARDRGDLVGRGGSAGSSVAMRDPLLASHFDFMRQFMREMSRMLEGWPFGTRSMGSPGYVSGFGSSAGAQGSVSGWPPIEVEERDGKMVIRAELPGMDMQDVRVRLEGNYLLIEGERRDDRRREREGYYETEWSYGRFSRRIPMPPGVTPDQIHATCDNGVLELTIDVPSQNVREIPIRTGRESDERISGRRVRERDEPGPGH